MNPVFLYVYLGMAYKNKDVQKAFAVKHYEENKALYKERARLCTLRTRLKTRAYVDEYLASNPCVDCGEPDSIVLEFDHIVGEKDGNISDMIHKGFSMARIQKEISKCEVRCANCHRRATYYRRKEI